MNMDGRSGEIDEIYSQITKLEETHQYGTYEYRRLVELHDEKVEELNLKNGFQPAAPAKTWSRDWSKQRKHVSQSLLTKKEVSQHCKDELKSELSKCSEKLEDEKGDEYTCECKEINNEGEYKDVLQEAKFAQDTLLTQQNEPAAQALMNQIEKWHQCKDQDAPAIDKKGHICVKLLRDNADVDGTENHKCYFARVDDHGGLSHFAEPIKIHLMAANNHCAGAEDEEVNLRDADESLRQKLDNADLIHAYYAERLELDVKDIAPFTLNMHKINKLAIVSAQGVVIGSEMPVITDGVLVHKWSSLQSVFVGSADIREQLPDDSNRFDQIDADFKALQGVSQGVLVVITSCNNEDRAALHESLKKKTELCEKLLESQEKELSEHKATTDSMVNQQQAPQGTLDGIESEALARCDAKRARAAWPRKRGPRQKVPSEATKGSAKRGQMKRRIARAAPRSAERRAHRSGELPAARSAE